MTAPTDDLEAVRQLVATLSGVDAKDRDRVIRWAREKLGMEAAPMPPAPSPVPTPPGGRDIRSFMDAKKPTTDSQFVAAVAYYYRFEAPQVERKETIGAEELLDACRTAPWHRPARPAQTLIDASKAGYLDRTTEQGRYRINSVGENLVAMVLPGQSAGGGTTAAPARRGRRPQGRKAPKAKKKSPRTK
jgi:hypothetical protein